MPRPLTAADAGQHGLQMRLFCGPCRAIWTADDEILQVFGVSHAGQPLRALPWRCPDCGAAPDWMEVLKQPEAFSPSEMLERVEW